MNKPFTAEDFNNHNHVVNFAPLNFGRLPVIDFPPYLPVWQVAYQAHVDTVDILTVLEHLFPDAWKGDTLVEPILAKTLIETLGPVGS